eukprot:249192-Pleurochrysis_carterae.AAC.1
MQGGIEYFSTRRLRALRKLEKDLHRLLCEEAALSGEEISHAELLRLQQGEPIGWGRVLLKAEHLRRDCELLLLLIDHLCHHGITRSFFAREPGCVARRARQHTTRATDSVRQRVERREPADGEVGDVCQARFEGHACIQRPFHTPFGLLHVLGRALAHEDHMGKARVQSIVSLQKLVGNDGENPLVIVDGLVHLVHEGHHSLRCILAALCGFEAPRQHHGILIGEGRLQTLRKIGIAFQRLGRDQKRLKLQGIRVIVRVGRAFVVLRRLLRSSHRNMLILGVHEPYLRSSLDQVRDLVEERVDHGQINQTSELLLALLEVPRIGVFVQKQWRCLFRPSGQKLRVEPHVKVEVAQELHQVDVGKFTRVLREK